MKKNKKMWRHYEKSQWHKCKVWDMREKNNLLLQVTKSDSHLSREQNLKVFWIFPTFLLHEKRKHNYGTPISFHLRVQWSNVSLHEHEKNSSGALA